MAAFKGYYIEVNGQMLFLGEQSDEEGALAATEGLTCLHPTATPKAAGWPCWTPKVLSSRWGTFWTMMLSWLLPRSMNVIVARTAGVPAVDVIKVFAAHMEQGEE